MKERMNYSEFLDEVFKELTENKDWNLQEVTMKMFMDGCKGKEQADKLFIQRINLEQAESCLFKESTISTTV